MESKIYSNIVDIYKESGIHYRHLENQRNQYLGFYFTFLPASIALASTIVKGTGFDIYLLVCIEIAFLLNLSIGLLIVSAIKKIGFALNMHAKIILDFTDKILAESELSFDEITSPYNRNNPVYRSKVLSTQGSILKVLIFIGLLLDALFIIILVKINNIPLGILIPCLVLPFAVIGYFQIRIFLKKI